MPTSINTKFITKKEKYQNEYMVPTHIKNKHLKTHKRSYIHYNNI